MNGHVSLPPSSKQELSDSHVMDIISNLPNPILNYVLSFLSTKDVIKTSVLSRRWRNLWTFITNIDLEEGSLPEASHSSFVEFVDQVITLHHTSKIKRLRLSLNLPSTCPSLDFWIRYALSKNVEELDLFLGLKQQDELPLWLFTSPSLNFLRISANLSFKARPSTNLINLKRLHLSLVLFPDEVSTQRLFSNCPVLEELALKNCEWKHIQSVTISIPTLKSLSIEVHNEVVLDCVIFIFSFNITYLYCSTDFSVNLCICDLPSLDRAFVEVPCPEAVMDGIACRARRLFSSIYNVKSLRISHDVLWSIMELENLWENIPNFQYLIQLELGSKATPCYLRLMKFLNKTPNLEDLNIFESCDDKLFDSEEGEDGLYGLEEDGEILENVPSCLSSSLKIFSISYFEGRPKEMELASFVLRNAIILRKMTIYCHGNLSNEFKRTLLKNQLDKLPKVSKSCVIELRKDSQPLL